MVEHTAVNRGVVGSSPTRGVFHYIRPHGQAVKTSPFHGGNTGSIPVGVIMASWLSWLERRPVTAEVVGSSPIGVVK